MTAHNPNHRFTSKVSADNDLTRLVGHATLHALQDRFASLGQVTVCICTVEGELITEPTWGSRFSALIGTSATGSKIFLQNLKELAANPDNEVPSLCHEGLSLYATRVMTERGPIATIIAGTRPPHPPTTDEIARAAKVYAIDAQKLISAVEQRAVHTGATPEAVRQFADTLADTLATLYSQASRIQQHLADLSIVHDLANLLAGTRKLEEVLDITVRRVVDVMPVKACGIRLLNPDTDELEVKAVCNLSSDYLAKGPVTLTASRIDAAAFSGEIVFIEDAQNDPRIRYPQNTIREGIVSGLCVPMTYRGETVGVLRVYTGHTYRFSASEGALLRSIGSQAAAAVINLRLIEQQYAAEQFQQQANAAGDIQRRMLAADRPQSAKFEFGCLYTPSLQVGGDFYDLVDLPAGGIAICIGDVVGKGMPAALLMASLKSALMVTARMNPSISTAMGDLNRHMCRETKPSEFATLVYGILEQNGGSFAFCNAGHLKPILLRNDQVSSIGEGSFVFGVDPTAQFLEERIDLSQGDTLVLITDGITEAMNFDGEQYGNDRLHESILRHGGLSAELLAHQIQWDVRRFVGLAEQSDDITIVVARRI